MSNKKTFTRLVDIETREIVGECELTPAAAKRLVKHYAAFGYCGSGGINDSREDTRRRFSGERAS